MSNPNLLILASSSPARLELLKQINIIPNLVQHSNVDETKGRYEKAFALCKRLSAAKAISIKNLYPHDYYIIGADTVVVRGGSILGKPQNSEQATSFLTSLSGKKHEVVTGVSVIAPNNIQRTNVVSTTVKFKRLTTAEINYYIASNEWQGKAGGYSIQGLAAMFIEQIVGSYSNIVGLPINTCYNLLTGLGYQTLWQQKNN